MPDKPFDPIPTRHSLLNRLKDWADQSSWQDFFDTYWQLIYHVAVKAGLSDTEAQEVVQETVIAVARKIGEFKADPTHGSFSGWLMQLTRWRIADQFRKRQAGLARATPGNALSPQTDSTAETDLINGVPDPAAVGLETIWSEEWEKNLLEAALEQVKHQVSPRQYQMFDLHALQNLSVQATARTLKVSVASVYMAKSRISRLVGNTVKMLRQEMGLIKPKAPSNRL